MPLLIGGCGSSSNDQGVSFTLLGFGQTVIDTTTKAITCSDSIFTNNLSVPITEAVQSSGSTIGCLVLSNNMTKVSIRTERINLSYSIPGASIQPPATSTSGTIVLGPEATAANTSPAIPNKLALQANVIPSAIREWISNHRNSLPPLPFSMDVMVSVTGVSTAGDQIITNDAFLQVNITKASKVGSSVTPTATPGA